MEGSESASEVDKNRDDNHKNIADLHGVRGNMDKLASDSEETEGIHDQASIRPSKDNDSDAKRYNNDYKNDNNMKEDDLDFLTFVMPRPLHSDEEPKEDLKSKSKAGTGSSSRHDSVPNPTRTHNSIFVKTKDRGDV